MILVDIMMPSNKEKRDKRSSSRDYVEKESDTTPRVNVSTLCTQAVAVTAISKPTPRSEFESLNVTAPMVTNTTSTASTISTAQHYFPTSLQTTDHNFGHMPNWGMNPNVRMPIASYGYTHAQSPQTDVNTRMEKLENCLSKLIDAMASNQ